jgi:hypothetical protein
MFKANSQSPWGNAISSAGSNPQLQAALGQWLNTSNSPSWTTGSDVMPQSTFSGSGDTYTQTGQEQGWM